MKITATQKDMIIRIVGIFISITLFLGMLSAFGSIFTPWGDGEKKPYDDVISQPDVGENEKPEVPTEPTYIPDIPADFSRSLTGGKQNISANSSGIGYSFYTKLSGDFSIIYDDENAYVFIVEDGHVQYIESGYIFSFISGVPITFIMTTKDMSEDTFDVVVDFYKEPANNLVVGKQIVEANFSGVEYVFTSEFGGNYLLTFTDSAACVILITDNISEEIESGYSFSLGAGESIRFAMSTESMEDVNYYITLSNDNTVFFGSGYIDPDGWT